MVLDGGSALPEDIRKLGAEGVNQLWRDTKLRGAGMKREKTLVSAAEHSIGNKEAAPEAVRIELRNLLNDIDVYTSRMEGRLRNLEEGLTGIPYIDKLLDIKGLGLITVSGFIAEGETLDVLTIPNNCKSWQDMQSCQMIPERITEKAGLAAGAGNA